MSLTVFLLLLSCSLAGAQKQRENVFTSEIEAKIRERRQGSSCQPDMCDLLTSLAELGARLNSAENQITAFKTAAEKQVVHNGILETRLSSAENQVNALQAENTVTQNKLEISEKQGTALQKELVDLKKEVATLQRKHAALTAEQETTVTKLNATESPVEKLPQSPVNAAIRGIAAQSSQWNAGRPSNAIDGNWDGNWYGASCTHTLEDLNPWWRLDLHKTYKVISVTIQNRVDDVPSRLNGAEIRIGHSPHNNGVNNPRCGVFRTDNGLLQTFQCNGMEGRYVTVVIPGRREYLTLCEVEVYGYALD